MSSPSQPVAPRVGYQAPGPFNLNVQDVPPPVALYVRKDEILRVQINNSQANVTVSVGFRMMMSDGQVIDTSIDYKPPSDRTAFVKAIAMEEGYLLSVIVTASANPGKRGQTFVQIQQGRGNSSGLITATSLLISDYVGSSLAACWPGGNIRSSLEGPGNLQTVQSSIPGVGTNFTITVPTGARWRVAGGNATITTSAVVANRQPILRLQLASAGFLFSYSAAVVPANTAAAYIWTPGVQVQDFVTPVVNHLVPMPNPAIMLAGGVINVFTNFIDAGDQWTAASFQIEEWLEP